MLTDNTINEVLSDSPDDLVLSVKALRGEPCVRKRKEKKRKESKSSVKMAETVNHNMDVFLQYFRDDVQTHMDTCFTDLCINDEGRTFWQFHKIDGIDAQEMEKKLLHVYCEVHKQDIGEYASSGDQVRYLAGPGICMGTIAAVRTTPQGIVYDVLAKEKLYADVRQFELTKVAVKAKTVKKSFQGILPVFKMGTLHLTPQEMYDYFDKHIVGQDNAKKDISMLLWNHLRGIKTNLLLIGPTGCGKTEIVRTLKLLFPYVGIVDGSRITDEGFSGDIKTTSVFRTLRTQFSEQEVQHAIVVIDEFDKFCEPRFAHHGENISFSRQSELLGLVEGTQLSLPASRAYPEPLNIDTSQVSFIFLGAFEKLFTAMDVKQRSAGIGFSAQAKKHVEGLRTDKYAFHPTLHDMEEFGIRGELLSRISKICFMEPLNDERMRDILNIKLNTFVKEKEVTYRRSIIVPDTVREDIIRECTASGLGARAVESAIQRRIDDAIFTNGDDTGSLVLQNIDENDR